MGLLNTATTISSRAKKEDAINPKICCCQCITMQKNLKMIETLAYGYSSKSTPKELSNEYQHDKV